MALPNSGPITMAQVAAELGISASGLSLNDSRVRQLAGKPSGAISMADLRGKSSVWVATLTPAKVASYTTGYGEGKGGLSPNVFNGITITYLVQYADGDHLLIKTNNNAAFLNAVSSIEVDGHVRTYTGTYQGFLQFGTLPESYLYNRKGQSLTVKITPR